MTILKHNLNILDRTGKGRDTFSYSGYRKRIVGFMGTYRRQTCLEASYRHVARTARFHYRF